MWWMLKILSLDTILLLIGGILLFEPIEINYTAVGLIALSIGAVNLIISVNMMHKYLANRHREYVLRRAQENRTRERMP
jgi:hypothetical protein